MPADSCSSHILMPALLSQPYTHLSNQMPESNSLLPRGNSAIPRNLTSHAYLLTLFPLSPVALWCKYHPASIHCPPECVLCFRLGFPAICCACMTLCLPIALSPLSLTPFWISFLLLACFWLLPVFWRKHELWLILLVSESCICVQTCVLTEPYTIIP